MEGYKRGREGDVSTCNLRNLPANFEFSGLGCGWLREGRIRTGVETPRLSLPHLSLV